MSNRHKPKHKLPPVKPAPPIKAEPEDIDEVGNLSESEKRILASTVESFGKAAGQGVSQIPAEFLPKAPSSPPTNPAGLHPVYKPEPSEEERVKAFFTTPAPILPKVTPAPVLPEARFVTQEDTPLFFDSPAGRVATSEALEAMASNAAVGAPLFTGLAVEEIELVFWVYQHGVSNLLRTGATNSPVAPLDLRGLVALTLRGQEDRHNRRALLDVCARLNISAEELTLEVLSQQVEAEKPRLGLAAEEIPVLTPSPANEALWDEYKRELGLVKRRAPYEVSGKGGK